MAVHRAAEEADLCEPGAKAGLHSQFQVIQSCVMRHNIVCTYVCMCVFMCVGSALTMEVESANYGSQVSRSASWTPGIKFTHPRGEL